VLFRGGIKRPEPDSFCRSEAPGLGQVDIGATKDERNTCRGCVGTGALSKTQQVSIVLPTRTKAQHNATGSRSIARRLEWPRSITSGARFTAGHPPIPATGRELAVPWTALLNLELLRHGHQPERRVLAIAVERCTGSLSEKKLGLDLLQHEQEHDERGLRDNPMR
jgi:hypothetical protein